MRQHLDLPSLQALQEEWRQNPPVHHLVAGYLDYRPPVQPGSPEHTQALDALMDGMAPAEKLPPIDTSAWDSRATSIQK